MTWQITRHAGPGEHSLGGQVWVFDDDSTVVTDDTLAVETARQFPASFTVEPAPGKAPTSPRAAPTPAPDPGEGDAPQDSPGEPGATPTEAELEMLTVAELRDLATAAGVSGQSRMNKGELIAALLHQEGA